MIQAAFGDNTLTVEGHAGFAPAGQDIVCAAVSALVYALMGTLEQKDNIAALECRKGYVRVRARRDDPAFDVVRCGLGQLAGKFGEYVRVEES